MGPDGLLERLEALVDASGAAPWLEGRLPVGVRPRQLSVRSLLLGVALAFADGRPAHLTRAHDALLALGEQDKWRLGVLADWHGAPHRLSYRQVWWAAHLVLGVIAKGCPDGAPSKEARWFLAALVGASVPGWAAALSSSLAVDWTDLESWACPPLAKGGPCADPEASWGHRRGDSPGQKDELFWGYYLSLGTMVEDEGGPEVPELVRLAALGSCHVDPVPEMAAELEAYAGRGNPIGDVVADCGYSHRVAGNWAAKLRAIGGRLVQDLHPDDRGPRGTHEGAICANGNLYCPAAPKALLSLVAPARGASQEDLAAYDQKAGELARYKLGRVSSEDQDGYHRVACPAVLGKLRCPLRPSSLALGYDRPSVTTWPEHPPKCCTQKTLTVPAGVNEKTAQRHDWGSAAWRASYARRSAAERANSTIKDPATNDVSRGWCRMMGLAPLVFFLAALLAVRNLRVIDAFEARQAEDARRAAAGLPPKRRRRRRKSLRDLMAASANAPP